MSSVGRKKIVYKDGDYSKVAIGETFFELEFIRVETIKGTIWIGKSAVVSIKPEDG